MDMSVLCWLPVLVQGACALRRDIKCPKDKDNVSTDAAGPLPKDLRPTSLTQS